MKTLKHRVFMLVAMFLAIPALAQVAMPDPSLPVSSDEFIQLLLNSLGGLKGASGLAVTMVVVQLVMAFLRTPIADSLFGKPSAKLRLVIVSALTVVGGVVALKISGLSTGAALVHASTMAYLQVFLHNLYSNFIEKPVDPSAKK